MPKVFISLPMNGRTDKDIKDSMEKMHKIAEVYAGEPLEVVDSFLEGADYTGNPLACLGESIKRMQSADYFICIDDAYSWNGCYIEKEVAYCYLKREQIIEVQSRILMPDLKVAKLQMEFNS